MFGFSDDADYVYALKSCNLPVYSVFVCFLRCTLHRSWELKTITRQNEHSGSNISVKIARGCQMWLLCSRNLFCHSLVARDVLGVEGRRSWMFPRQCCGCRWPLGPRTIVTLTTASTVHREQVTATATSSIHHKYLSVYLRTKQQSRTKVFGRLQYVLSHCLEVISFVFIGLLGELWPGLTSDQLLWGTMST